MDARIVHIIHDEVIVEARENVAEHVKGIVKKCMESAMEEMVPEVPFSVEPENGRNWEPA
jgi:DNA polymerase I